MQKKIPGSTQQWWRLVVLGLLWAWGLPAKAQEACLLVPVPLAERVQAATLVVEARVVAQQSVQDTRAQHIYTLNELEAYKVFEGTLPSSGPLRVATPGGTVGLLREEVSNSAQLAPGQQGIFFLEPDPANPGAYRLYAGPQGLIRYDVASGAASEPFARYASIQDDLYAALQQRTGASFRTVRPNAALEAAPQQAAQPGAAPAPSLLNPATVSAGTGTVLTITGTGFSAVRGNGKVGFRNANDGGQTFTYALSTDYVSWTDTQIQVRVPSSTSAGGPAGTGPVQVVTDEGQTGQTPTSLTVLYALTNVEYQGTAYRVKLYNQDNSGGYTLQYNARFAQSTAAAPFTRALTTWGCGTGANRRVAAATTTIATNARDNVNVVTFDDVTELPAGVLGTTYSYFNGSDCGSGLLWTLSETDYVFDEERTWQFGPAVPTGSEFDFESVVVHEQGHGIQLGHIIRPGAVMHYAIAPRTVSRTLDAAVDVVAAADEVAASLVANPCGAGTRPMLRLASTGCSAAPLPVELVNFEARYESKGGTRLSWATATERNTAYFAIETQTDKATAWTEVGRVQATGNSSQRRSYDYLDARTFSGLRYFRLRIVDQDGTLAYSPVQTVTGTDALSALQVYPNPATDQVQIRGVVSSGPAQLRLLDATGREVRRLTVPTGQEEATVSVAELRAGLYVAEWNNGTTVLRTRLVKQ